MMPTGWLNGIEPQWAWLTLGVALAGLEMLLPGYYLIWVFSARRFLSDNPIVSSDPLMNRRGARLAGQMALVVQAISHGSGRVRVGDGEWNVRGPDTAEGQWVKITGNDGATLLVERPALSANDLPAVD